MKSRKSVMIILAAGLGLSLVFLWPSASAAEEGLSAAAPGLFGDGVSDRPVAQFVRRGLARLLNLKADLNVTDDQREEIRGIVKSHRQELAPVIENVVAKRRALREAVMADEPVEESIRAAAADLGKAIGDAAVVASGVVGEVKDVLTPEQREILRQFRADREAAFDKLLEDFAAE